MKLLIVVDKLLTGFDAPPATYLYIDKQMRDHGLFVAFAPVAAPRYALACLVEHGALGHPQVQIAHDVLRFAQMRNPLALRPAYPPRAAMSGPPAPLGGRG